MRLRTMPLVFLLVAFGCAAEDPGVCAPGATQECVCSADLRGAQVCVDDGSRWGVCTCSGDAGIPGDSNVSDVSVFDATTFDATELDANEPDATLLDSTPDQMMQTQTCRDVSDLYELVLFDGNQICTEVLRDTFIFVTDLGGSFEIDFQTDIASCQVDRDCECNGTFRNQFGLVDFEWQLQSRLFTITGVRFGMPFTCLYRTV